MTDGHAAVPCEGSLPRLWRDAHGRRPLDDAGRLIVAGRTIFAGAFSAGGALLPANASFQHAFCGLLMLADWIGSDERVFPFSEPGDPSRVERAREWAATTLIRVGLAVKRCRGAVCGAAARDTIANGFALNAVQQAVATLPLEPPPQLVILESETGSGKTEAALLHFKRLFEAERVDGLYFALPTRSSASQIQARAERWAKRLIPVSKAVRRPFLTGSADRIAAAGRARVELVGKLSGQVLRPALYRLLRDRPGRQDKSVGSDTDIVSDDVKAKVKLWLNRFERQVDATFFPDLWREFEADREDESQLIRQAWLTEQVRRAHEFLDQACHAVPLASIHRYRTRTRAKGLFWVLARKHFPQLYPERTDAAADAVA